MAAVDAFAWWEDKQVAVVVRGAVVRGWVLTCRHDPVPTVGASAGQMTIVLLVSDATVAASFPDTVVVDVLEDGEHGQPRNVRGLWYEDDLADLHTAPQAVVPHAEQAEAPPGTRRKAPEH